MNDAMRRARELEAGPTRATTKRGAVQFAIDAIAKVIVGEDQGQELTADDHVRVCRAYLRLKDLLREM